MYGAYGPTQPTLSDICSNLIWCGNEKEARGLFQLKRFKSEIKHKFEQEVKNVSINRKHFIDNNIDLVSIETVKI